MIFSSALSDLLLILPSIFFMLSLKFYLGSSIRFLKYAFHASNMIDLSSSFLNMWETVKTTLLMSFSINSILSELGFN